MWAPAARTARGPPAYAGGVIPDIVADLRATYLSGLTRDLTWRVAQLRGVRRMLQERTGEFCDALQTDLGKHPTESRLTEIDFTVTETDHIARNLQDWLAPSKVGCPVILQPGSAEVVLEPLGVVLVIAPWNYPLQLTLSPLVGALAAGNAVVVKPSEVAPATSAALARWLPEYVDPAAVRVVEGGVPETTELLEQQFDHIFYTGNGTVGRIVMRAAAEHLTPVTLELGGKSPAWVDETVDLPTVARRLVWGRFTNAGQTCVAPDYVLAPPRVLDALVPHLRSAIESFYGADPRTSESLGRIVNPRHAQRLADLLEGTEPLIGGEVDVPSRYVAPTVVRGLPDEHPLLHEEIFGPILPLVEAPGPDWAIVHINARDKPLAMYLFTQSEDVVQAFLDRTSSGGVGVNVPLAQLMVPDLPFGGVGPSGMGRYHGRHSVETFSHHRSVLRKPLAPDTLRVVYPPYAKLQSAMAGLMAPLGRIRLPRR